MPSKENEQIYPHRNRRPNDHSREKFSHPRLMHIQKEKGTNRHGQIRTIDKARLIYRCIQFYTFKGDGVLDPFIGSGSTALAALKSDRYFVGYDIKSEYVENAYKRIRLAEEQPKLYPPYFSRIARLNTDSHFFLKITNN